jgi:hypothetical protein
MARLRARRDRAHEAPRTQKPQGRKKKRKEEVVHPGVLEPPGVKSTAGSDPKYKEPLLSAYDMSD